MLNEDYHRTKDPTAWSHGRFYRTFYDGPLREARRVVIDLVPEGARVLDIASGTGALWCRVATGYQGVRDPLHDFLAWMSGRCGPDPSGGWRESGRHLTDVGLPRERSEKWDAAGCSLLPICLSV